MDRWEWCIYKDHETVSYGVVYGEANVLGTAKCIASSMLRRFHGDRAEVRQEANDIADLSYRTPHTKWDRQVYPVNGTY